MNKDKIQRIKLQRWQIKKLLFWGILYTAISTMFLTFATWDLYQDKTGEDYYWSHYLNEDSLSEQEAEEIAAGAKDIETGVYVESVKEINKKSGYFRVVSEIWFKWDNESGSEDLDMMNHFRIYNGYINKMEVIKNITNGNERYQRCRVDATVNHKFWTKRFPLESHQLRFYIEPDYALRQIRLIPDMENSTINEHMGIAGYELRQFDVAETIVEMNSTFDEPGFEDNMYRSELLTAIEINRSGSGLYLECFIALFGTTFWVLITLYICTYHRVDPLGMIPAALFGTVSNVMVGANQISEELDLGLLIYVNAWGILTIISCAVAIININRIRNKFQDNWFAKVYGQMMFYLVLYYVILGHIVLPYAAYLRG